MPALAAGDPWRGRPSGVSTGRDPPPPEPNAIRLWAGASGVWGGAVCCPRNLHPREQIFIEIMMSNRQLKASREGDLRCFKDLTMHDVQPKCFRGRRCGVGV